MSRQRFDVIVAGGGVAGASAALALARLGLATALVEPREAAAWQPEAALDLRVFALAPSAARLFAELGVWDAIVARRVSPYRTMQVTDAANGARLGFDAAARGQSELGWIVENRVLVATLRQALAEAGVREIRSHARGIAASSDRATLDLADGCSLGARLVVAAEGGDSPLRQAAGIGVRERDYAARAVVAHVALERTHEGIAWQRFLASGPLALLPLADGRMSVVWSLPVNEAERVLGLDDAAFLGALAVASDFRFGRALETTPRAAFPLKLRIARRFADDRLVLAGDAAHVVHPLAGQGINLGLRDVAELRDVLADALRRGRDIGAPDVLARYARRRRSAAVLDGKAFDAIERLHGARSPLIHALRGFGLRAVDRMTPLKRLLAAHAAGD